MKNLLVAIDFEDTSRYALRVAREMATAVGARLHLLHVIPVTRHSGRAPVLVVRGQ